MEDKSFIRIHDNYESVENFLAKIKKHERSKSRLSSGEPTISKESITKSTKRVGGGMPGNLVDLRTKMLQINKGKRKSKTQNQE